METSILHGVYVGVTYCFNFHCAAALRARHESIGAVLVRMVVQIAKLLPKLGWSCDFLRHSYKAAQLPVSSLFSRNEPHNSSWNIKTESHINQARNPEMRAACPATQVVWGVMGPRV